MPTAQPQTWITNRVVTLPIVRRVRVSPIWNRRASFCRRTGTHQLGECRSLLRVSLCNESRWLRTMAEGARSDRWRRTARWQRVLRIRSPSALGPTCRARGRRQVCRYVGRGTFPESSFSGERGARAPITQKTERVKLLAQMSQYSGPTQYFYRKMPRIDIRFSPSCRARSLGVCS